MNQEAICRMVWGRFLESTIHLMIALVFLNFEQDDWRDSRDRNTYFPFRIEDGCHYEVSYLTLISNETKEYRR